MGHLEYRNLLPAHPHDPSWHRKDLYVTFRKAISADDEENMNAIPRKQRAMVRKGIKHGLRSEIDPSVDRFFALYADNMHRHGTPPFSSISILRASTSRHTTSYADACAARWAARAGLGTDRLK